jgi:hypothetical protein
VMVAQRLVEYCTYATRRGRHFMIGGAWRRRGAERRKAIDDAAAAACYGVELERDAGPSRARSEESGKLNVT